MSAAVLLSCGAGGIALGGFAAGRIAQPRSSMTSYDMAATQDDGSEDRLTAATGTDDGAGGGDSDYAGMTRPVVCKGCGPTLAERRIMGNDQGFVDGAMTPDAYTRAVETEMGDETVRAPTAQEQGMAKPAGPSAVTQSSGVGTISLASHPGRVATSEGAHGEPPALIRTPPPVLQRTAPKSSY
ncbi:hypothetical protein PX699_02705 [Sphingobium sp. H39-3-25]|uniref:hypothetical protein n=1 Tax=Sphingobium arseniciresistens TaxID=3030834 RepID=UPI0023B8D7A3|nr:hypothetical protein [Sphingobium arseniciresistens]